MNWFKTKETHTPKNTHKIKPTLKSPVVFQYYAESHAVIYVVDSSDRDRIEESKAAFGGFLFMTCVCVCVCVCARVCVM